MQTLEVITVENEIVTGSPAGHETLACQPVGHDVASVNLAVCKTTLTEIAILNLTDEELHLGVRDSLIRGRAAYNDFRSLLAEVKLRINENKTVAGCSTFKDYVEKFLTAAVESTETALRRAYYQIQDLNVREIPERTGRPKSKKPAVMIVVKDGVSKEAVAEAVEKTKDAIFESGRRAGKMLQEKQAAEAETLGTENKVHVLEALKFADTFARSIAVAVNSNGTVNNVKAVKAARKSAVLYCKLRGISFLAEPEAVQS